MSLRDKLKPVLKFLKIASLCGSGVFFVAYQIRQTYTSIQKVVNPNVLEREKYTAEYVYIEDPTYSETLQIEQDRQSKQSVGLARIWKSLKHSLAWRLLWLCRHGNREQRNVALEKLAGFKNNKKWDCLKLAQALDQRTAVLLARTRGADLRYFLPPPLHVRRAALSNELLSFKLRDLIVAVQATNRHSCIQHFLSKYFINVQDHAMETDGIPIKPDSIAERDLCILCLDAIHHHITLFHTKDYDSDISTATLVKMGLLSNLAELLLRYKNDVDIDMAVLRVLTVLSVHSNLLVDFFQNGLIGELSRLVRAKDIRLSSSAAVCLANLSGEYCYRPGLYLLHPLYRTTTPHTCDTLLVHGLRGGVFVTWRQRDKKCSEPIGLIDVTVSDVDCEPCEDKSTVETKFIDPEIQEVVKELMEIKEENFLADYDVVLHDVPIASKREPVLSYPYNCATTKREALVQEDEDRCNRTFCWPKDWLPKDCHNLRILGVNYWSSLSEWLGGCPLQTAEIETRAAHLAPALVDAGVGRKKVPVVWLAHSMGGLIVKQVLNEASDTEDSMLKKLAENTKAILFFSTPHKGSSLATMPRAAAAVFWPSNDVTQLQQNSPTLLQLHTSFLKFADIYNWETISFAEAMPTLVTAFKVPIHLVEAVSADLGRGVFYQLPLDHLAICKPATRQSILYTTVLDVIKRVTMKDVELTYENRYIQWLVELYWWAMRITPNESSEGSDENQANERLRWFERILLDAFTDGFTD